ncbi:MAG: hypothetical protein FWH37_01030 [Candidatus Bathyarchaeota archaeon]|nr:hypothetical protein [Candidatus Termiticorpusculum sp.]
MDKQLTKILVSILVTLLFTSFITISSTVADRTINQEKALDFMENVLSIDLSKYDIDIIMDSTRDSSIRRDDDNRKINDMRYELKTENSNVRINFCFENDIFENYFIGSEDKQVITTKQYTNQHDAVKDFLERYQFYTNIDSKKFITMIDKVDFTINSTTISGDTKLVVTSSVFWEVRQTRLRWTHTVSGVDYNVLELIVEEDGFVSYLIDTWVLYTVGDTSINVSREQAIDIAIENMYLYAYDMYDGEVVKDFKVHRDNVVTQLYSAPKDVAYELRPYWKVELILDEVYSGNVFGISVFIWAGTGEVISWGNMASGGVYDIEDNSFSDVGSPDNTWVIVAIVVVVFMALVIGVLFKKRYK